MCTTNYYVKHVGCGRRLVQLGVVVIEFNCGHRGQVRLLVACSRG